MFGCVYAAEGSPRETLLDVAREFSPRVESCADREVTLDLSGLARLFGDAKTIARELRRTAADRGLRVRAAIAGTRTAARLLARSRPGLTVIEPGTQAAALAPLSIDLLSAVAQPDIPTLRRWGLRTLGDLAAIPAADLAARVGQDGVTWQRLARGEDLSPLVPAVPEERFEQALDLEWPIDALEPLSFVLGRLMEPLSAHLERRDRGAAALHVRLRLVTREVHERTLQLPAPMRDPRTLRTLALLDLESHPPSAAIDRVVVAVDPTPGRVLQFSLITRPLPSPEQLSTLMARLNALMGEGRCGSPMEVDSWQSGAFQMKPFAPADISASHRHETPRRRDTEDHKDAGFSGEDHKCARLGVSVSRCSVDASVAPVVALRRFRFPVPARVRAESERPVRVMTDRRGLSGGRVVTCAGPWRTSGVWWQPQQPASAEAGSLRDPTSQRWPRRPPSLAHSASYGESRRSVSVGGSAPSARVGGWDRDEWDVTLTDGATWRLFRDRDADAWFVDGIVD